MNRLLFTLGLSFFLAGTAIGQIPDSQIDRDQYPANNTPDTKQEAIFSTYFEDANVSNMHFYLPATGQGMDDDYFFKGTEIPRGLYGIFYAKWREQLPEDFKAFAVFAIRGDGKPYYIMRFAGKDMDPAIGLFEIANGKLHRKAILATNWCGDNYCVQKDSWLQDFDGDVRLDILTKVKIMDNRYREEVIDEYYSISKQLDNGTFSADSQMDVNVNDYFMYEAEQ